jgi:hypothetical protein
MLKLIAMGLTSVLGLGLAGLLQEPLPRPGGGPPPPKAKAKKGAPKDELRKTYDLLRRVRSDASSGRTEERIKDWTDRATDLYRRAIRTREQGDPRIGIAAHDLARAVDHARNAARLDRPDPDLPPPLDGSGPEDIDDRTRRDLYRAYERIRSAGEYGPEADAKFFLDAARDLYNAARRDVEAGRDERAGELARASEAMTHVPEHLSNAGTGQPGGPGTRGVFDPPPPEPKKKDRAEPKKKDRARARGVLDPPPDPKGERSGARDRDLPPPLR